MDTNTAAIRAALAAALGRTIAAERVARRLSQPDLADLAGIHVNSVQRYETGERDIPHSATVALADALGMLPSELLRLSEERAYHDAAATNGAAADRER